MYSFISSLSIPLAVHINELMNSNVLQWNCINTDNSIIARTFIRIDTLNGSKSIFHTFVMYDYRGNFSPSSSTSHAPYSSNFFFYSWFSIMFYRKKSSSSTIAAMLSYNFIIPLLSISWLCHLYAFLLFYIHASNGDNQSLYMCMYIYVRMFLWR